jgi:nucleotide-binding universal stress UspA family protein
MTAADRKETDVLTIAHATDLEPEGGVAFRHSVALARDMGATLYSLHANPVSPEAGREMPDANEQLGQWPGSEGREVEFYKMLHTCCDDPVDTLLDAMRQIQPDLLVVGKHQTTGFFQLLRESVSEALALNTRVPTLFLPIGREGFVQEDTGAVQLERILLPVRDEQTFEEAARAVGDLIERLSARNVEIVLLHVGEDLDLDDLSTPTSEDGPRWRRVQRQGVLADEIAKCVDELDIDLIVMATEGHNSLGDVLSGSRTERVVRRSPCPLLSVPLAGE